MSEITHDSFPVMLEGRRRAYLALSVDLTPRDVQQIVKHLNFIAECSKDHALHNSAKPKSRRKP